MMAGNLRIEQRKWIGSDDEAALTGRHVHWTLPQWTSFFGGVVKNKVYERKPKQWTK